MKKKKETGLIDYLKDVPDPRVERTREHQLIEAVPQPANDNTYFHKVRKCQ